MSCGQIRARIAKAAVNFPGEAFAGKDPSRLALADGMLKDPHGAAEPLAVAIGRVSNGAVEANAENIPHGVTSEGMKKLYRGHVILAGGAMLKDRIQFAFGAEFVEVRGVHPRTREIRCPRVVGAFAAGQIVDPLTAKSQLMGGLIWASRQPCTRRPKSIAVTPAITIPPDPGQCRYRAAEVIFVPEEDRQVNDLGIKGLGELGNVGTNAAVANAVYHAAGVRIRELPIRLETPRCARIGT